MKYDEDQLNNISKAEGLEKKIIDHHDQFQHHKKEFNNSVKEYSDIVGSKKAEKLVENIEKEFLKNYRSM